MNSTKLKIAYKSSKTINPLMGDLDRLYQLNDESVKSFANRIRDIGANLIEARKNKDGTLPVTERTKIEVNIVECFIRGLSSKIKRRLNVSDDIKEIFKNALIIEQQLMNQYTIKICEYCSRPGHNINNCYKKIQIQRNQPICQLCNKQGHIAVQCRKIKQCFYCNKFGHSTEECRLRSVNAICQICNQSGHIASACYQLKRHTNNINTRPLITCQLCTKNGHSTSTCRTHKQGENPVNMDIPICNYCKAKGHTISECRKKEFNDKYLSDEERFLRKSTTQRNTHSTNIPTNTPYSNSKLISNPSSSCSLNFVCDKRENQTSINTNCKDTDNQDELTVTEWTEQSESIRSYSFISTNQNQNEKVDIIDSKSPDYSSISKASLKNINIPSNLIDINQDSSKKTNPNSNSKLNDDFIQNKVDAFEFSESYHNSDIEYLDIINETPRLLHSKITAEHKDIDPNSNKENKFFDFNTNNNFIQNGSDSFEFLQSHLNVDVEYSKVNDNLTFLDSKINTENNATIFENNLNSNSTMKYENHILKPFSDCSLAIQALKYFKFPLDTKFINNLISNNNSLSVFKLKTNNLNLDTTSPYDFKKIIVLHKRNYLVSNIVRDIYLYLFILIYINQNYLTHASNLTLNPVLNLMPIYLTYTLAY